MSLQFGFSRAPKSQTSECRSSDMLLLLQHLTLCIVAFQNVFLSFNFFPLIEGNNNVTKKRCLLNKHSLFLYLFLVHMNTEIQIGKRFENSCPYSNTECSSVCAISSFDCHERDLWQKWVQSAECKSEQNCCLAQEKISGLNS